MKWNTVPRWFAAAPTRTLETMKDRKDVKWERSEGKSPELISDYCVLRHKVVLLDRMRWG